MRWYRLAADQGDADAQYNLGAAYSAGDGVLPDYVQAYMWANLAASISSGDDQKKYSAARDAVGDKMTRPQIADAQRLSANGNRPATEMKAITRNG